MLDRTETSTNKKEGDFIKQRKPVNPCGYRLSRGGEDGIRTHARLLSNGFQDRPVMTSFGTSPYKEIVLRFDGAFNVLDRTRIEQPKIVRRFELRGRGKH